MSAAPSPWPLKGRNPFFTYRLHAGSESFGAPKIYGELGERRGIARALQPPEGGATDEDIARYHLERLFGQEEEAPLRNLLATERPQILPDLTTRDVVFLPDTKTKLVRFRQAFRSVPIFGSNVVVEIGSRNEFVSVAAKLTPEPEIPTMPRISAAEALQVIAKCAGKPAEAFERLVLPPMHRLLYGQATDAWHLTYFFPRVPAVPIDIVLELEHETGSRNSILAARALRSEYNYFVDAVSGDILLSYSADPLFASTGKALTPPALLTGKDEDSVVQEMYGTCVGNEFEMSDPQRDIKTFDLGFNDAHPSNLPNHPVRSSSATVNNPAAVSAHVNATVVWDFYNGLLGRRGVGKGMELISCVNCTDSTCQPPPPPEWFNAEWARGRMWYGQKRDGNGNLKSFSRFLDVIAHELTHGVTEANAGLMYKDQTGALDESISDIFGIIISNHALGRNSIATWNWQIGAGLGENGGPLRDLSQPHLTGDPEHMVDYVHMRADSGGVHTNSGIHNKAAYNLMVSTDGSGAAMFSPKEVALLYYYGVSRLGETDGFADMRDALEDVVATLYAGQHDLQERKIATIRAAYGDVGVSENAA